MKLRVLLLLLFSFILIFSQSRGQDEPLVKKFVEINAGIASIRDIGFFPGASFLFGRTEKYKSGFIWEGEIGLAFPTIITGKLGVGVGNEQANFIIGVRPFPLTAYAQCNISVDQKSSIIFSGELANSRDQYISVNSYGNFNIGYRWALKKKVHKIGSDLNYNL